MQDNGKFKGKNDLDQDPYSPLDLSLTLPLKPM